MRTILKILIMLVGVFTYAQTTVSGSITDQNDQPLSGATVIVVGTSSGVAADFDGNYSINELSKLFNNENRAVIVNIDKNKKHIITLQDMMNAIGN